MLKNLPEKPPVIALSDSLMLLRSMNFAEILKKSTALCCKKPPKPKDRPPKTAYGKKALASQALLVSQTLKNPDKHVDSLLETIKRYYASAKHQHKNQNTKTGDSLCCQDWRV